MVHQRLRRLAKEAHPRKMAGVARVPATMLRKKGKGTPEKSFHLEFFGVSRPTDLQPRGGGRCSLLYPTELPAFTCLLLSETTGRTPKNPRTRVSG
jgi:hypothetical protein